MRISPEVVGVGAGAHGLGQPELARFRSKLADPAAAAALVDAVEAIERKGYPLNGETYARAAKGFDVEGHAARFLRHGALFVHHDEPAALALDATRLVPTLARYWGPWPVAPLARRPRAGVKPAGQTVVDQGGQWT